jgi:hypothetical protein
MRRQSLTPGLYVFRWVLGAVLAIGLAVPARAQPIETDSSKAQGNWHSNVNGVAQAAKW